MPASRTSLRCNPPAPIRNRHARLIRRFDGELVLLVLLAFCSLSVWIGRNLGVVSIVPSGGVNCDQSDFDPSATNYALVPADATAQTGAAVFNVSWAPIYAVDISMCAIPIGCRPGATIVMADSVSGGPQTWNAKPPELTSKAWKRFRTLVPSHQGTFSAVQPWYRFSWIALGVLVTQYTLALSILSLAAWRIRQYVRATSYRKRLQNHFCVVCRYPSPSHWGSICTECGRTTV